MSSDYVTPINHTSGSAFAASAAGTAGGVLKGGLMTAALWVGGAALLGIGVAALVTTGGLAAVIGTAGASGVAGSGLLGFLTSPLTIGAGVGAFLGLLTVAIPAGLGAVVGGFKGHSKASERVNSERAAALEMQQSIAMQQAPMACMQGPANKYSLPAQGSAMNPAGTRINAAEYDGLAAAQQLQRA